MKIDKYNISRLTWFKLMSQLKKRGQGKRESGAFLLGKHNANDIIKILYYDDLDPSSLDLGYIKFNPEGFIKLWQYLFKYDLKVLADVHTHPKGWTDQSELDIKNPMIDSVNHIALIVPNFSKNIFNKLKGVGIFKYLGNYHWEKITN